MVLEIEVKNILQIENEDHDQYLYVMVPALAEYVADTCNYPFPKFPDGSYNFPGPVKIFIAKACEHNMGQAGLKAETMGSVSYSYDLDFPSSLEKFLRPYKRLKFHAAR